MSQIAYLWDRVATVLANLATSLTWRNFLDIAIVATLVYQVIKLIRQTRANSVLKGLALFFAVTWLSEVFQLNALNWVLLQIVNTGVIVLVILFQQEIRRGLEQIGRSSLRGGFLSGERGRQYGERNARELIDALVRLSRRKVGALVVLERNTGLKDILASGTTLDAQISSALLENIFEPNTPLHDGAVIIREGRIIAAGCVLPLSDNLSLSRELGTRHRAAIGISENTDAVALIASEETGILSVARDGKLSRYLDAKSLNALLTELFLPPEESSGRLIDRVLKRHKGGDAQ